VVPYRRGEMDHDQRQQHIGKEDVPLFVGIGRGLVG
jgi:hypothetical protein